MQVPNRATILCFLLGLPLSSVAYSADAVMRIEPTDYQRRTIYHSPQTPGYTCWVHAWRMPDSSVMVTFFEATGPMVGRPRAPEDIQKKLSWPHLSNPKRDMTGLSLCNVFLRSKDGGATWSDFTIIPGTTGRPQYLEWLGGGRLSFITEVFHNAGKPMAVICHGPWVLVESGVVRGKRLTSWPTLETDIRNAGGDFEIALVPGDFKEINELRREGRRLVGLEHAHTAAHVSVIDAGVELHIERVEKVWPFRGGFGQAVADVAHAAQDDIHPEQAA